MTDWECGDGDRFRGKLWGDPTGGLSRDYYGHACP